MMSSFRPYYDGETTQEQLAEFEEAFQIFAGNTKTYPEAASSPSSWRDVRLTKGDSMTLFRAMGINIRQDEYSDVVKRHSWYGRNDHLLDVDDEQVGEVGLSLDEFVSAMTERCQTREDDAWIEIAEALGAGVKNGQLGPTRTEVSYVLAAIAGPLDEEQEEDLNNIVDQFLFSEDPTRVDCNALAYDLQFWTETGAQRSSVIQSYAEAIGVLVQNDCGEVSNEELKIMLSQVGCRLLC